MVHWSNTQMTPEQIVEERGKDYGSPCQDFTRIAKLWSAILGTYIDPRFVPLCMIAVKMSREVHKHKEDNISDIAGYAKTIEMFYEDTNET